MKVQLLFITVLLPYLIYANNCTGIVVDKISKKGLEHVIVYNEQGISIGISNGFGQFEVPCDKEKKGKLKLKLLGYKSLEFSIEDNAIDLWLEMEMDHIDLPEIEIQSQRKYSHLINAIDLQLRPLQSSQDILNTIPGLFIGQHAGGGKAEQIFFRGFDIDHGTDIKLEVDGLPVNMVSHAHGQGYADLHFIIPELIEKVEYRNGPYSASDGDFATTGAISFNTLHHIDKPQLKIEAGQFDYKRAFAATPIHKHQHNKHHSHAYVAGEYVFNNSFFDSPQKFNRVNIFTKYNKNLGINKSFETILSGFYSQWNASGQIPTRAVESGLISRWGAIDDKEGGKTSRYNASIKYSQQLNRHSLFTSQVYYSRYQFDLISNFTFFLNNPTDGDRIRQIENRDLAGLQLNWKSNRLFSLAGLQLETGIGNRSDWVHDVQLNRITQQNIILSNVAKGDIRQFNHFAFAQFNYNISTNLEVTAALRGEFIHSQYRDKLIQNNDFVKAIQAGALLPKFSLRYYPIKQLEINAKWGQGFHSNDTRVVFNGVSEELPKANSLDLELIWKPLTKTFLNLTAWHLELEDELVYVGDEGIVESSGRTRRYGLDISLRQQIADAIFFDINVSACKPRALDTEIGEDYIPLASVLNSTGGLQYRSEKKKWYGSLRYRFLGDRSANEDNSLTAPGYLVFDATTGYKWKKWDLGIQALNLLNTKWNETQFETTSRLLNEASEGFTEIHFTPGTPFFAKVFLKFTL